MSRLRRNLYNRWAVIRQTVKRLMGRLYYFWMTLLIRRLRPELWRLAQDMEQYYDDYDPYEYRESWEALEFCGLPTSMDGAVRYTAASLYKWDFDHEEHFDQFVDMDEDDADYQRGKDIHRRLVVWKQKKELTLAKGVNLKKALAPQEEHYARTVFDPKYLLQYRFGADDQIYNVRLSVKSYQDNDNMFVALVATNGWNFDVTVNIRDLPPFFAAINTYGPGQDNIIDFLESNNIAKKTEQSLSSGFVTCPIYQFDQDVLRLHDPNGFAKYEKVIKSLEDLDEGEV